MSSLILPPSNILNALALVFEACEIMYLSHSVLIYIFSKLTSNPGLRLHLVYVAIDFSKYKQEGGESESRKGKDEKKGCI